MRYALTLTLATAAALASLSANAADQGRTVAPFTSVSNAGAINLFIEVGKAQSLVVHGSDDFLADLVTEVVGSELRIHPRHDHIDDRHWNDIKVTITVPQLQAIDMAGAGQTTLTHMTGDRLDVRFSGAGSLKADGSVHDLRLTIGGVGAIDARELHADTVNASIGGVGSVKVWAGQRLDASLGGVGSLTYYGDPKVVNATGGGLGSISKAR
jgi:Putative auto-transporter adhesin, head GIN domain